MREYPMTKEQAAGVRYGQWAGNLKGVQYDPGQCAMEVWERIFPEWQQDGIIMYLGGNDPRMEVPMPESSKRYKGKAILIGIGVIIVLILYSYFIPDTIRTRITDAQMAKVEGHYMIATEYRPFVNHDAKYRLKFDSGTVQNEAIRLKGKEVMIRKYGWRIPVFSMYENVVSIKETK